MALLLPPFAQTNRPKVCKLANQRSVYNERVVDRRIEKGKATRGRLLDTGRRLFGERGYEATSIDAILSEAGVAKGALYHHFADKQQLFDAVLDRTLAEIAGRIAEVAGAGDDALANLRAGCHAWLEMALDPAIQRIAILDPPAAVGWARGRELDERHALGGVRAALLRLADEGRVPAGEVDALAHMVLAAVNEAALLIVRADDQEAALAAGRAAVDTLLARLAGGTDD
jgi:AcrR family transcriptional regulator